MGERKVLNKYFGADFDPEKQPKGKKLDLDGVMSLRLMLPFTMSCTTCGNSMAAATKVNAKKEAAKGMDYIKVKRIRFRFKCSVCKSFITFLTDPKNTDFEMESGATRAYEFKQEVSETERAAAEKAEAEGADGDGKSSMQKLEQRTLDSKKQMDKLEQLELLRSKSRSRNAVDLHDLHKKDEQDKSDPADAIFDAQAEDNAVAEAFAKKRSHVKRIERDEDDGVVAGESEDKSSVDKDADKAKDGAELALPAGIVRKRKRDKPSKKKKKKKSKKKDEPKKALIAYASSGDESD